MRKITRAIVRRCWRAQAAAYRLAALLTGKRISWTKHAADPELRRELVTDAVYSFAHAVGLEECTGTLTTKDSQSLTKRGQLPFVLGALYEARGERGGLITVECKAIDRKMIIAFADMPTSQLEIERVT
jgi:hypothetical protein